MTLRKATQADAKALAICLFLALEEVLYVFIQQKNKDKALLLLCNFTMRKNNLYSFENCYVAEEKGCIIGAINCYNGAQFIALAKPIFTYIQTHLNPNFSLEIETQPGEYYIDSFGVLPEYQGQGIGTELLRHLIDVYGRKKQQRLGLLVSKENSTAKKLYTQLGFISRGTKPLALKSFEHLQWMPKSPLSAKRKE